MSDIYAINICTNTKNSDRYDKVAVNPYPIIVIGTQNTLKDVLSSEKTQFYIKNLFRVKSLYDSGVFRIRHIDKDKYVDEFEWSIPEICEIEYNEI